MLYLVKEEVKVKNQKKFINILNHLFLMVFFFFSKSNKNYFLGYYLEIFGRRNNLRNKWVTIGNEI